MTQTQFQVFFEVHSGLPREGPGSSETTARAFRAIPGAERARRILDAGCGPGAHTFELAELSAAEITAVDTHEPFLEQVRETAAARGLADRVTALNADMADLPFEAGTLDIVWSEAAIYNIGFRRGLELWRPLLATGGAVAVSEVTWLRKDPPREPRRFWEEEYPAITTQAENEATVRAAGYELLSSFALPESAWWDEYYSLIEKKLADLRRRYAVDPEALELLDAEQQEIDLYRSYSAYYGYVFYVGRRAD